MKRNINIINITPRGYCNGVVRAIKIINDLISSNNYKKPLYMFGQLVHNSHVTNALINKGVIMINDYHNINEGTIIVTAHGLSLKEQNYILSKGLDIIDTTCTEVTKIQNVVKEKVDGGYVVLYYGKHNHPEAKAVLNDNSNVILVSNKEDVINLDIDINSNIFFTNQTTMSYFDTLEVMKVIKEKFNNVDVNIDICTASKRKQIAVYNSCRECDIVLVIGDKKSNNTSKLQDICNQFNIKNYLIEDISDLNNITIYDNMNIGITAGSSTPNKLVNEIIKTLEDDEYISNLTDNDYINF